jgi:hypothetical protein
MEIPIIFIRGLWLVNEVVVEDIPNLDLSYVSE